ncbi:MULTISPECIES: porin [Burkholderiaceae]|uniref:porin n=1 Tax=Burkholderiaceae TaxID=119060 RepID=UPI00141FFF01|nr:MULTISPECIES: porin [Burkholderiaceae]NIF54944.1 porin [Burkholderia sp. Ax-1724]NIF76093.1 porin [Paraburkholderia sp. Cy-641]
MRTLAWKIIFGTLTYQLAVCATTAHAQSSVTMYGLLDTGIEYLTNANKTSHSALVASSGNIQASRWGILGVEDIGSGYYTTFTLEAGITPNTGALALNGRLFGRQATVGFRGHGNQLWIGRAYNPMYQMGNLFDPASYALYSLPTQDPGLSARGDNSIRYQRAFGSFTFDAFYSLGVDTLAAPIGGTAGASANAKDLALALHYSGPAFGYELLYDNLRGPLSASGAGLTAVATSLTAAPSTSSDRARRFIAAGSYHFHDTTLYAGYRLLKSDYARQSLNANLFWTGFRQRLGPQWALVGALYQTIVPGKDVKPFSAVTEVKYNLSKRTMLYWNMSYVHNSANSNLAVDSGSYTLPGQKQFGTELGIFHSF